MAVFVEFLHVQMGMGIDKYCLHSLLLGNKDVLLYDELL